MRFVLSPFVSIVGVVLTAALYGACAEPDPNFGTPSGIIGRKLPNEPTGGGGAGGVFGAEYSASANKPTTTLKAAHEGQAGAPQPPQSAPCLSCHVAGGTAPEFVFGGRVVSGEAGEADVDVIVVEGTSTNRGPVKTDADGYFWLAGAPLKEAGKTYIRKGTEKNEMGGEIVAGAQGHGSCDKNGCHTPESATKPIHL